MSRTVRAFVFGLAVFLTANWVFPLAVFGQTQAQWRYKFHNGEWWYWLPESRWVYWRGNRWNDYQPQAVVSAVPSTVNGYSVSSVAPRYTAPAYGYAAPTYGYAAPTYGYATGVASDVRPFYGHSFSAPEYRPNGGDEIQPFYGHALPGQVFGSRGWGGFDAGPFYGHAVGN